MTIDADFGELIYRENLAHCGLIRLPDVRVDERIALLDQVLQRHFRELERGGIVTVRGRRIRISHMSPAHQAPEP